MTAELFSNPNSFPFVVLGGMLLASVLYRAFRNKPVLFFTVPGAEFLEHMATAGRMKACVVVAISGGRLIVRPFFPFTLFFGPEMSGMECDLPLECVLEAKTKNIWIGQRITLRVQDADGGSREITLELAEPDRFLDLLPMAAREERFPHLH
jgi:hypothetical protein